MWFRFKFLYFISAFVIGLFMCSILEPPREVVVKFPSPYNAGSIVYNGADEKCYKYDADKVACPMDKETIKHQPVFAN